MPGVFTEISVTQSGDTGGAGISRFHFQSPGGVVPAPSDLNTMTLSLKNFYAAIANRLPISVTWTVQQEVRILDVDTGILQAMAAAPSAQSPVQGAVAAASYPAGVGARINWRTGNVVDGRQLRGATFICPLAGATYANDGSINTAVTASLLTAANNLLTAASTGSVLMGVYHRPKKTGGDLGVFGPITVPTVGTTAASLRSRRV